MAERAPTEQSEVPPVSTSCTPPVTLAEDRRLVLWSIRQTVSRTRAMDTADRKGEARKDISGSWVVVGEETEAWTSAVFLEQRNDGNVEKQ